FRNGREDWTNEVTSFGSVAHAGGLSAEVSSALVTFIDSETPKNSPLMSSDGQSWNKDRVISHLRQEWGDSYNEMMAAANKAATSDPRLEEWLDRTGAGNSPYVVQVLAEYGRDPHLFNPATAQAKADKILNDPKHPYWTGNQSARLLVSLLFAVANAQGGR